MFNKVIANLAFSPTGIAQVSFYAKRLRQEESIRRVGLILIVFSMLIQVFAAMVPPEKSLAASGNDVISGGVSSISDLKNKYNARADVKALYNRFGLDSSSMNTTGGAQNTSFNFQEQGSKGTRTVGRVNFASTNDNYLGNFAGSNFYSRSAAEWSGSAPAYYFDKHKGTDGNYYYVWVLKDCGNIAYRRADSTVGVTGPAEVVNPPKATPTPAPAPTPTPAPSTIPKVQLPTTPTPTPETPTTPTVTTPVCPNNPAYKENDERCKCIDNPNITASDEKCLTPKRAKQATNLTQRLTPDQTLITKAKSSDTIEYLLAVTNNNTVAREGYIVEDYIGDVLDYAVLDENFLASQGGSFDPATKTIKYPAQAVPAKGQLNKTFRVTLKTTIPSTNQPNATATDYDCKMQNGFGNETVIPVDCSVIKTAATTLPNTGPGTTIAIAFAVAVFSGYFFMRSRLLAKEMTIIKRSYQAGV